jgi:hypothetical protein
VKIKNVVYDREIYIVISANKGKCGTINILKTGECKGSLEIQMKLIHTILYLQI